MVKQKVPGFAPQSGKTLTNILSALRCTTATISLTFWRIVIRELDFGPNVAAPNSQSGGNLFNDVGTSTIRLFTTVIYKFS
jgi:hypothetical protein